MSNVHASLEDPRYSPLFESIRRPFSILMAKNNLGSVIPWDTMPDDVAEDLLDFLELLQMVKNRAQFPTLRDFCALIEPVEGLCNVNAWLIDVYTEAIRVEESGNLDNTGSPVHQLAQVRREKGPVRLLVPALWPLVDEMYWAGLKQENWSPQGQVANIGTVVSNVSRASH